MLAAKNTCLFLIKSKQHKQHRFVRVYPGQASVSEISQNVDVQATKVAVLRNCEKDKTCLMFEGEFARVVEGGEDVADADRDLALSKSWPKLHDLGAKLGKDNQT